MKIPYSWLGEYVDLRETAPQRVAELLTLRTCEVDAVHHVGGGLEGVKIGHVVECGKHPNADKLSVTKVDVGIGETLQIVCGAPNVAAGQRVAVAVPGSKLPNGMEIGERAMRGVTSRGMICSERELGLGDEHDGILVLESEAEVGKPVASLRSFEDWVIEIDNKSVNHRPDLWGVYGFARELACVLGRELCTLPGADLSKAPAGESFPVVVSDDGRCRRYLAGVLAGVQVGAAPAWMRRRLRLCGARAISNIVDVTNYVMFEIGQPTHAFDRAKLRGGRIDVRTARDGETLVTLDGQTRKLLSSDLVIADGEGATGLAGVMGGAMSEVSEATSEIVLESASFDAATVRRTAARLGLRSEASARFEKSLDPEGADAALSRIVAFVEQGLFGSAARLAAPVTMAGKGRGIRRKVIFTWRGVEERLGLTAEEGRSERASWASILSRLGIVLEPAAAQSAEGEITATIPTYRSTKDLTEPIDLVEEIARLRGYENVVPRPLAAPVLPPPSQGARRALVRRVEDRLAALGFRGLESYSFLPDALIEKLGLSSRSFVTVKNSIVVDQSRVRRAVLPSLLGLVERNLALEPDLRLFEVGKGYLPERPRQDPWVGGQPGEPLEVHSVAGVLARSGPQSDHFDGAIFYEAKGFVGSLLDGLDLRAEFVPLDRLVRPDGTFAAKVPAYLHPKRSMIVGVSHKAPRILGYFGELHPEVAERLGLLGISVAGFELDLDAMEVACGEAGARRFTPIPKFPGITVDVALAAPESVRADELEALVRATDAKLCRSIALFDVYRSAELGAGLRSVAFHVELRSDERTLGDADESSFLKALAGRAEQAGFTLRGWSAK
ncbi:MAG: phenylalanine--tRNA ligase subunit beta [Planctomycetes bacterium]|nr:phenylalanine--tRNA ligase subunit beta [Planctomycetota bacterium]